MYSIISDTCIWLASSVWNVPCVTVRSPRSWQGSGSWSRPREEEVVHVHGRLVVSQHEGRRLVTFAHLCVGLAHGPVAAQPRLHALGRRRSHGLRPHRQPWALQVNRQQEVVCLQPALPSWTQEMGSGLCWNHSSGPTKETTRSGLFVVRRLCITESRKCLICSSLTQQMLGAL